VQKLLNLIGLAMRAKKVVSGEDFCADGIRSGAIKYVFLANDAGANTTKKITDKANFYNVPVDTIFSSSEISKAIGKNNRMVIGITDIGFAKKMKEIR
jgi:ribosomal protein L7Ae-like RNA K-turn-binding protein